MGVCDCVCMFVVIVHIHMLGLCVLVTKYTVICPEGCGRRERIIAATCSLSDSIVIGLRHPFPLPPVAM